MTEKTHFLFDKPLDSSELNFWSTFFDVFPCHHNSSFQSVINIYSNTYKSQETYGSFESLYSTIKNYETNQQLFDLIISQNWPEPAKDSFPKIINDLNKIIPNAKPVELFLMTIYSGNITAWDLEINSNGINLLNTHNNEADRKTFVPQLSLITDLMGGRINEIFPDLNFAPRIISGEQEIINTNDNNKFIVYIEEDKIKPFFSNLNYSTIVGRYSKDKSTKKIDFSYSYSYSSSGNLLHFAPLEQEQTRLISLIGKNYLDNSLNIEEKRYNKKTKI